MTRNEDNALTIPEALQAVDSFSSVCTILYSTPQRTQMYYQLSREYSITGLKVHDVEIASIALTNQIAEVVTFNTKDFDYIEGLDCIDPPEV